MGLISAKTAFFAYTVLGLLAAVTLDGDHRKLALAALALFAVKTYVDILRRRLQARETADAENAPPQPPERAA